MIQVFMPLMALWVAFGTIHTLCALTLATYRTRAVPPLDAVGALAGSAVCLYIANEQTTFGAIAGFCLFVAGWAATGAIAWSSGALESARSSAR